MSNFSDLQIHQQSGNVFDLHVDDQSKTLRLELLNPGTQPDLGGSISPDCHTRAELKGWIRGLRQELDEHEKSAEQVFDEWEQKRNCPEEETEIPDSFNLDDLRW